jgi:hypothetical protein
MLTVHPYGCASPAVAMLFRAGKWNGRRAMRPLSHKVVDLV